MRLADQIREAVSGGAFAPGQLIGSEHELARREKISRVTVRRASELLIKEGLIERRPGKGLFVRTPASIQRIVQIISGNLNWEPSIQLSRGAQSFARNNGIQVQLYDAKGDAGQDLDCLRRLPTGHACGAIVMSLHTAEFNEEVRHLHSRGFPFVVVDQHFHELDVSCVVSDNRAGGYEAGRVLLAQGHRRIAFIGDLVATTVQQRLAGLRDAIADGGLPFDRSLVVDLGAEAAPLHDWSARVDACTREVMGTAQPPTAIFFSCDALARPAYRTLAALGLRIPQDVSIVGFDDDPLAEWLTPALTTVRQPFFEMGRTAMDILCRRMAAPRAAAERVQLPVTMVERASVGAVPEPGFAAAGRRAALPAG